MAHWPRWIDNDGVDSQAMLGSYLNYVTELEQNNRPMPWFYGLLWDVVHRERTTVWNYMAERVDPPCLVLHRPCLAPHCARCEEGRGGYQFRWYSALWAANYNRIRRPGSWEAPELHPGQQFPNM